MGDCGGLRVMLSRWTLGAALTLASGCAPSATFTVSCAEIGDPDRTRAVLEWDGSVTAFQIVTPEYLWHDPDQPETRRFDAGESDTSPDLVGRPGVYLRTLAGPDGTPRVLDFGVDEPDALELEGLRGSLIYHEPFVDGRAFGSLYYTALGGITAVVPVACERFAD
jgi:hypothetical protein